MCKSSGLYESTRSNKPNNTIKNPISSSHAPNADLRALRRQQIGDKIIALAVVCDFAHVQFLPNRFFVGASMTLMIKSSMSSVGLPSACIRCHSSYKARTNSPCSYRSRVRRFTLPISAPPRVLCGYRISLPRKRRMCENEKARRISREPQASSGLCITNL